MRKIGIVTFCRANNYGAKLQAFALKESLRLNGYEAEVINYSCKHIEDMYLNSDKKTFISVLKQMIRSCIWIRSMIKIKRKRNRFDYFSTQYLQLDELITENNVFLLDERYDLFISGSDQVWNLDITNKDWNYFLAFAEPEKRYSYAASFGNCFYNDERDRYYNEISSFNSILVREKFAKKKLVDLGIPRDQINVVLDPVFLIDSAMWKSIFKIKEKKTQPYVLVYTVAKQDHLFSCASKYAKDNGLAIRYIMLSGMPDRNIPKSFNVIMDAGPVEFLSLIANASCVFTTSFHALAFSIIFNIPFFYELDKRKNGNNSRLLELSDLFSIHSREVVSDNCNESKELDWEMINGIVKKESKKSLNRLLCALQN